MTASRKVRYRGKVVVAMSGGVDSSVAAAILKEEGYEVVGCFMRLGSEDRVESPEGEACRPGKPHHQGCCSVNDAGDARLVAALLDIPFYVLNFRQDFDRVIDYFVDEYNAGRTPNPCVRCNDWLKFGKLMAYAKSIGAQAVATGHYARIDRSGPRPRLLRGLDHRKDQSYVLFGSPRERLERMMLPVGALEKPAVRQIAQSWLLPVFDKPDSQEICFVPGNDYGALVRSRAPAQVQPGAILDQDGRTIGEHPGHQHFTIGQRRGVGVALGYPVYVVDRDPQANSVTVGSREALQSGGLVATEVNWLVDMPAGPVRCQAKVRYNSPPVDATLFPMGADAIEVRFEAPVSAVTPGQAVVCYQDDLCLGGGWIDRALLS
jgi:tRNA-specific 2-thiouridylase